MLHALSEQSAHQAWAECICDDTGQQDLSKVKTITMSLVYHQYQTGQLVQTILMTNMQVEKQVWHDPPISLS